MRSESSCRTAGAPSRRASGCVPLGVPGVPLPPGTSSASSASCSLQMAATPKSSSLIRGAWRTRLGSAAPTPTSLPPPPPPPPPPLSRRPRRHGARDARLAERLGSDGREADEGREHDESRLEVESREEVDLRAELARDDELLRRKEPLRRKEVRGEARPLAGAECARP